MPTSDLFRQLAFQNALTNIGGLMGALGTHSTNPAVPGQALSNFFGGMGQNNANLMQTMFQIEENKRRQQMDEERLRLQQGQLGLQQKKFERESAEYDRQVKALADKVGRFNEATQPLSGGGAAGLGVGVGPAPTALEAAGFGPQTSAAAQIMGPGEEFDKLLATMATQKSPTQIGEEAFAQAAGQEAGTLSVNPRRGVKLVEVGRPGDPGMIDIKEYNPNTGEWSSTPMSKYSLDDKTDFWAIDPDNPEFEQRWTYDRFQERHMPSGKYRNAPISRQDWMAMIPGLQRNRPIPPGGTGTRPIQPLGETRDLPRPTVGEQAEVRMAREALKAGRSRAEVEQMMRDRGIDPRYLDDERIK